MRIRHDLGAEDILPEDPDRAMSGIPNTSSGHFCGFQGSLRQHAQAKLMEDHERVWHPRKGHQHHQMCLQWI